MGYVIQEMDSESRNRKEERKMGRKAEIGSEICDMGQIFNLSMETKKARLCHC